MMKKVKLNMCAWTHIIGCRKTHCYNGDINKLDSKRKFFTESQSTHLMSSHLWFIAVQSQSCCYFCVIHLCWNMQEHFLSIQTACQWDGLNLITLDASEFLQLLCINVGKVCWLCGTLFNEQIQCVIQWQPNNTSPYAQTDSSSIHSYRFSSLSIPLINNWDYTTVFIYLASLQLTWKENNTETIKQRTTNKINASVDTTGSAKIKIQK